MIGNKEIEVEMSPEEFTQIRDFIHEKSGIYFAENKMYLVKNRLSKRMTELGMKAVRDYFYHVKYDASQVEFNKLMCLITTNETSFFRNEPQLQSFYQEVLPKLIKEKKEQGGRKQIRIWSAGCSTGEEPYTLAIQLLEAQKADPGWTLEIIANDISEQVLHKARKGEYSGITLRNISPSLLSTYFDKRGDLYVVKPEVKSLVKFSQINLNDPRKIGMVSSIDVIFCRNVMIYFSDEVRKQLVRGFYNALNPGGYFYIGHSETLHGISKAFKLVYLKSALVYRKESVTAQSAKSTIARTTSGKTATAPGNSAHSRALDLLNKIKPAGAVVAGSK